MKKALITGALGQDGSYLAEYLISLGYEVHGLVKGVGWEDANYQAGVQYHVGDMRDELSIENVFRKVWPDEVYNLAGQVFVPTSWTHPTATFDVNTGGLARLLTVVLNLKKNTKVYQASSSEMFGNQSGDLTERSPMLPVSPYGSSKLAAHNLCSVYRLKGLFVVSGILFNHESPRRSDYMVTRKITKAIARWVCGDFELLELGSLNASRDWGSAQDYVKVMHMMLQNNEPKDYVVGTGISHTVGEFLREAVAAAGLGWIKVKDLVVANSESFSRGTTELFHLRANTEKIRQELGWRPQVTFKEVVREMVESDIQREKKRRVLTEVEI